jgi:hypothetical protein
VGEWYAFFVGVKLGEALGIAAGEAVILQPLVVPLTVLSGMWFLAGWMWRGE